ncbi:YgaP family membrane protein [Kaarinaea lacus]
MESVTEKRKHTTIPNPYNIGFIDRSLRFIIGGILFGSIFYLSPSAMVSIAGFEMMLVKLLPIVSIYPLLTAWVGWDPFYHLANISSSMPIKEDVCADIVDQVKTATHSKS